MKIYLAGSISGGRQYESGIKAIAAVLEEAGHKILTPFVIDAELNKRRFSNLPKEERARAIFEEDLNLLVKADAVVAEISTSSTGVGIELGFLLGLQVFNGVEKPTLCLRDGSLAESDISKLIEGNPHIMLRHYNSHDKEDLREKLNFFLFSFETLEQRIKRERG